MAWLGISPFYFGNAYRALFLHLRAAFTREEEKLESNPGHLTPQVTTLTARHFISVHQLSTKRLELLGSRTLSSGDAMYRKYPKQLTEASKAFNVRQKMF